jgi:PAS domain S-box-containing protein
MSEVRDASGGNHMKILIVDDMLDARQVLRYMVKKTGNEAIEAENGLEGLRMAQSSPPDLIISDVLMPVMDGFKFLRAVKQVPALRSIPFVFYSSSYTEEQDVRLAMSLGANAYFFKPIDPVELWEEIKDVLEQATQNDQSPTTGLINEDAEYLKRYSEVVATKLEEKVLELEKALAERNQAEEILRRQEHELTAIFENAPFIIFILDGERRIRRMNALACSFTGSSSTDMVGLRVGEALHCLHALDSTRGYGSEPYCRQCALRQTIRDTHETGRSHYQVEVCLSHFIDDKEQNSTFVISTTRIVINESPLVLLSLQDITEHKKLEEQFRQAQKMEAVGTLAGGVAHDFNNLLGVILGHAEMAMEMLDPAQPIFNSLQIIFNTAKRSADLTRQLLAFARRQTIDPRVLDLNETVEGMIKMLQRLIGENIKLEWLPEAAVCPVKMDPSQIDQILANLCVNARDAIAGVGRITIETHSVSFDEAYCAEHSGFVAGEYVLLTVSDDGCGMTKETLDKLFEPFFTTKEIGKGTGLGLATVYGIVKQNNAFINVSSEQGQGATFKIYLPRHMAEDEEMWQEIPVARVAGGDEIILLVEDEPTILEMTRMMLGGLGYRVLTASTPSEAISLTRRHEAEIHLLLTDVILPEMNGRELGQILTSNCPGLKVLFMSGYTGDVIARQGVLAEDIDFMQKPFSKETLATKVRHALDGR